MGFPKVFERPVSIPPEAAYAAALAWLAEERAKVTLASPSRRIEARCGKVLRLASQRTARKIVEIDFLPIPGGTVIRINMPIAAYYFDDAAFMEAQITRTWVLFVDGLWRRFGYPPSMM